MTAVIEPEALPVIEDEAQRLGVELLEVREGDGWSDVITDLSGTSFVDPRSGERFQVPLAGAFQAANAALAVAACRAFDPGRVDDRVIAAGLAATRFPGRIEIVQSSPLVVLDGAHNPDKIRSLVANLGALFPCRRIIAVFGVLESKSHAEMLAILAPYVDILVATAPQVLAKPPVTAEDLAREAAALVNTVVAVPEPLDAVETALSLAGPIDLVLVTGSLYLIGNARERWYPTERVLEQGTSWPTG